MRRGRFTQEEEVAHPCDTTPTNDARPSQYDTGEKESAKDGNDSHSGGDDVSMQDGESGQDRERDCNDDDRAPRRTPDKADVNTKPDQYSTPVPSRSPGGPDRTYMTLYIEKITGILQETRQYAGLKAAVGATALIDPRAKYHPLYSNSQYVPISKSDDVPEDPIVLGDYAIPANPRSLLEQTGKYEGSDKPRENFNIFLTLLLSSKVEPQYICDRVNPSLGKKGVQCRLGIKTLQFLEVGPRFALVGIHTDNCPAGIASVLTTMCEDEEALQRKNNPQYPFEDVPFPPINVRMVAFRDMQVKDSRQVVQTSRAMSWTKRGPQIETSSEDWHRIEPIMKVLDEKKYLTKFLGRNVTYLPTGNNIWRTEKQKEAYQEEVRGQISSNFFYKVAELTGLALPNKRCKVTYTAAANKSKEKRTMSIRDVIMGIQVPDTPQKLTFDWAFEAVIPINRGERAGNSYVTYLDDRVGAIVGRGRRRKTKGPIVTIIENMEGVMAGPWLWNYMTHELLFTTGSVESLMRSFTGEFRGPHGDCDWDTDTWVVTSPAHQRANTTLHMVESRMGRRGVAVDVVDLSTLLSDKEKVDRVMDDEELKAREEMIRSERLYAKPGDRRVGASGASARTETSDADISAVNSAARSTATENIQSNYRKAKLKNATQAGQIAALIEACKSAGIDPKTVLANYDDESISSRSDDDDGRGCGDDDDENDSSDVEEVEMASESAGRSDRRAQGATCRGTPSES